VQFAVILRSPDDMGSVKTASSEHARARPRQNVMLELGDFVGKLTTERGVALNREGDLELPNDIAGLVYRPYDAAGYWRFEAEFAQENLIGPPGARGHKSPLVRAGGLIAQP
jgi:predicted nucleotide-binding protein